MSNSNLVSIQQTDFRSLLKQLFDAITVSQFYEALSNITVSYEAGFIDSEELDVIYHLASLLDPALYTRWAAEE